MLKPEKNLEARVAKISHSWTPTHTKILLLHSEGKPVHEIAKEVGIGRAAVKKILDSDTLRRNLKLVRDNVVQTVMSERLELMSRTTLKEARDMLEKACTQAVANIILMANDPECKSRVQLEACKDILDRAGLKPLVITETRERVYSPAEVVSAKKVLDEAQDIVKRLSNNTSPFVLGDSSEGVFVSSDTDKAHDATKEEILGQ